MAQFNSESFEGMSSLPTNSHGGMLMRHRCAIRFAVQTVIAEGDNLVLARLPAGYVIDQITVDTDGITGLAVNLVQKETVEAVEKTTLASAVDLATAGVADVKVEKDAIRFDGSDQSLYLVAEATAGGTFAVGDEVGVTFSYRYRQVAT